jgi:hypothetical protein
VLVVVNSHPGAHLIDGVDDAGLTANGSSQVEGAGWGWFGAAFPKPNA